MQDYVSLEIIKKRGSSINPDIHHSKVFSSGCLKIFYFSGHIHELQIHVPWTRLQSEPIVLTINTIECVLRLPSGKTGSVSGESGVSQESSRKPKRNKIEEAAPGYIQNLVNKIISNVQVGQNNIHFVLKFKYS